MRPIMCLLSRGRRRRRRHGPLMTSGFFSPSGAAVADPFVAPFAAFGVSGIDDAAGTASLAGVSKSFVDLEGTGWSDSLFMSVPGVGGEAKSLYEFSVMRGIFQGNRRNDMQQNMMANDQISAGWGSYFLSS